MVEISKLLIQNYSRMKNQNTDNSAFDLCFPKYQEGKEQKERNKIEK